ncbi:hypothetical protein QBC33DRAFT_516095 [Phialemonium atrogriseum]|uniref:Glucose-methanol-choline oxidoreductase N-terminal domain-containing protein n=1 Tax=Phialemonium atrogriseum TaxID=1093897 RepID=A0AAJ0C1X5_9PEZI|nr:uncharacterized protein QBC33DRAFT_516095 [Phialemonium atrogriseum]KAK1766191.1 hypothetical protein QBC33DRAFT_516095 [Phialemonium atrogriseum]
MPASAKMLTSLVKGLLVFAPLLRATPIIRESSIRGESMPARSGTHTTISLSEDSNATVLIVEYGYFDNSTKMLQPQSATRYLRQGHNRTNLQILTGWRVNDVQCNRGRTPNGGPDQLTTVRATREILLTAKSLHSGIGPSWLLEKANIFVLVDLPGVGSNLQDHPVGHVSFRYADHTDVSSNPSSSSTNGTFLAWQQQEPHVPNDKEHGRTDPPKVVSPDRWETMVETYRGQDAKDRGTILLDPADIYADPVLDYNTFINPVDALIQVENVRFIRRFQKTPSVMALGPVERAPGTDVTSERRPRRRRAIRRNIRRYSKSRNGSIG